MTSWAVDDAGVVGLPDGRLIRGTGARRPRGQAPTPEFAVYLLGRDPRVADWPYRWVRWPDFRLPASTADAVDALREAHKQAASERVEIACGGGVGRTGTALVVLAVMSGISADAAVEWVRANSTPAPSRTAANAPGSPPSRPPSPDTKHPSPRRTPPERTRSPCPCAPTCSQYLPGSRPCLSE